MNFYQLDEQVQIWLENQVKFSNIKKAMEQSLEYVVISGTWRFEEKTYGQSGLKTISAAGHFDSFTKGEFFVVGHAVDQYNVDVTYDSKTGHILGPGVFRSGDYIHIIGVVSKKYNRACGRIKQLGVNQQLSTPYEFANWVKKVIDAWEPPRDGGDDEESVTPTPELSPSLVPAPVPV